MFDTTSSDVVKSIVVLLAGWSYGNFRIIIVCQSSLGKKLFLFLEKSDRQRYGESRNYIHIYIIYVYIYIQEDVTLLAITPTLKPLMQRFSLMYAFIVRFFIIF